MRLDGLRDHPYVESALSAAWSVGRVVNHDVPRALRPGGPDVVGDGGGFDPALAGDTRVAASGDEVAESPFSPEAVGGRNPVLTAGDVTDYGDVDFVADPFLYPADGRWDLFFEVYSHGRDPPAVIGHATSPDGREWEYDRVVLNVGAHLAFPYVFGWDGGRYMVPDAGDRAEVTLYEADDYPVSWRPVATPVSGTHRTDDAVVFRRGGQWWLLVGDDDDDGFNIYTSPTLLADDWTPHRDNPVVTDRPRAYRPGGRPVVHDGRLVVFFQDCERMYGGKVRAFEVTALGLETYDDRELSPSPILEGEGGLVGWNAGRMHHIDPWPVGDRWLCAVDGNISTKTDLLFTARHWAIGVYTV